MTLARRARLRLVLVVALVTALGPVPGAASARIDPGLGDSTGRASGLDDVLSGEPSLGLGAHRSHRPARGVWPMRPRPDVVRRFEPPASRWGPGHRGADLAGHVGQPVRTALAGTVSFVGRIAGRGVVVVDHGATRTTYEPVLGSVSRGQRLAAGDVVGRLAGAGSHCAPRACLHWGLRRGSTYLDPLTLVDAPRPVRLLPW